MPVNTENQLFYLLHIPQDLLWQVLREKGKTCQIWADPTLIKYVERRLLQYTRAQATDTQ